MSEQTGGFLRKTLWSLVLSACLAGNAAGQTLNLPPRPAGAPTGSQFINIVRRMPRAERENWIYAQVLSGNVPNFLRALVSINVNATINGTPHAATYHVTPDYLAIGTDADYFLEPMTPLLAQRLGDAIGCTLPTRKMVNQIWTNAQVKLSPQPIPPSAEMITVPVFAQHDSMVRTQRNLFTNSFPLGALVSGDKKDVILSSKIYTDFANPGITKPVVIYGWHYTSGVPIQPLYNGHEETYADYSHGIRLVQNAMVLDGSPAAVTNLLTNPNLAALLSDEGAAESTSNGVIAIPRYTISPLPAALLSPPRSQTVTPGSTVLFETLAVGQPPLSFRWQFNGSTLPGATNSSLAVSNVQSPNSGAYTVTVTNSFGSASAVRPATLRVVPATHPLLFADDFETDSSAQWSLFWGASNNIPDYTAQWNFDHTLLPNTFNGATTLIPPAPNSPKGASHALRLSVNNNDTSASIAALNLYPKNQSFRDNFALKFDLWLNYPGDVGGINSTGSTQHAIFGIDHLGTQPNWAAPTAASSDGIWFGVDGEGGASRDYMAFVGNSSSRPTELLGLAASGLAESNNSAPFYQALFPPNRFETAGAPGKNWVEVELRQTNNTIIWLLDGSVVAQRLNTSSFTAGTIMLGFMDTFNSIANPASDAFVLFDNVRVEDWGDRIRFLDVSRHADGEVALKLSAVPGRDYTVESSTDLATWQFLATARCLDRPLQFIDAAAPATRRFYRARQGVP